MRVVYDPDGEYPDVINSFYELSRFNNESTEEVFFQGYNTSISSSIKEPYKDYRRRVYMNLEAPCSFFTATDAVLSQDFFTESYTICPYTADWLNASNLTDTKYFPIAFPIRMEALAAYSDVQPSGKEIDVAYMGTVVSDEHNAIVDLIQNYKYMFATLHSDPRATAVSVRCVEKWCMLSSVKMNVAVNLLYPNDSHIQLLKKYPGWQQNVAFSHVDQYIVPQFKPRVIESAACKVLNLVKRDPWNVIENWFVPKEEFLYWDDLVGLKRLIEDVLADYEAYWSIVERAYEKVKQYDIDTIYRQIEAQV